MSLYILWLLAGIVSTMIVLLAIERSLSKKKIPIKKQESTTINPKMATVISIEKRFSDIKKSALVR